MTAVDSIFAIITTTLDIIKWTWWIFLLIGILICKIRWKNYPFEAVIIEKRGDNLIKTNDRFGKFVDPYTKMVNCKFLKSKDSIPMVHLEWILHNAYRPTNIFEKLINRLRGDVGTVFFFKYGTKQYKPIQVNKGKNVTIEYKEIKNNKGESIYIQCYKQFDPRMYLGEIEFDIIDWDDINQMVQEQRAAVMRNKSSSEFVRGVVVPLVMMAVATIFVIIMIKFGFDYAMAMKNSAPQIKETNQPATTPDIPIISDLIPGK